MTATALTQVTLPAERGSQRFTLVGHDGGALSRRLIFAPVAMPTRMLYCSDDRYIAPELFLGQNFRLTQPLDLVRMAGAGHFMQWEQPDGFGDQVLGFLR